MTEFEIIKKYFASRSIKRADVIESIGDDAAIVAVPKNQQLVITTDTLIAGRHFPHETSPFDIGHKSLAVNLSDLAAMGATPHWVTMALTLPKADEVWIKHFCDGFFELAHRYQVELIGGDLTEGPLSITIQALGCIPAQKALLRKGAKPSDLLYVTGTLGDAGLALKCLKEKHSLDPAYKEMIFAKLNRPEPCVEIGEKLRGIAHAAIDISDGLAADLKHILEKSGVGAILHVDQLPLSEALIHSLSHEEAIALALTSGDDYELCFTVPENNRLALENIFSTLSCRLTCVGKITKEKNLSMYDQGKKYHGPRFGYQHFKSN